ncbi:MAG: nucleotidyltransferase [Polyangia bacterium]
MATTVLDPDWVARYSRGPAESTVSRAISLHQNVRDLLGQGPHETLLQGSYKNDTALAEMHDVDVLAIRNDITRSRLPLFRSINWAAIFEEIEKRLEGDSRYAGKWKRNDKCITLETGVHVDIVPAVGAKDPARDPIIIHSFSANSEKENWPRCHYENGAAKNTRCGANFKPTVRLFKRWVRCHFWPTKVAPSYYVECLLHSLPDACFSGDLAQNFLAIGKTILGRHDVDGGYSLTKLPRLDGGGDLFTPDEWSRKLFVVFLARLRESIQYGASAVSQGYADRAKAAWRMAFAGFEP